MAAIQEEPRQIASLTVNVFEKGTRTHSFLNAQSRRHSLLLSWMKNFKRKLSGDQVPNDPILRANSNLFLKILGKQGRGSVQWPSGGDLEGKWRQRFLNREESLWVSVSWNFASFSPIASVFHWTDCLSYLTHDGTFWPPKANRSAAFASEFWQHHPWSL